MRRKWFAYPYAVWMAIFIFAPMLLIVYFAFTSNNGLTLQGLFSADVHFTLNNLSDAIDPLYLQVLLRSIWMAVRCTMLCLLLGYPIAFLLSRMKRSTATILSVLFVVPMWMNFLLRTYAWKVILDNNGILNGLMTLLGLPPQEFLYTEMAVMLGMVYNFLPFMILPLHTALDKMDTSVIEAARDLGANGWNTFRKVIFPLSLPGVISGITMVFIPAITTFAISKLLGGGMFMMYGDLIENQFLLMQDWGSGSALSFILLILVLISMAIMRRAERSSDEEGSKLW